MVILTAHFGVDSVKVLQGKTKISKRIFSFIDIIYTNTNLFVLYIFAVSNNMYQITDIISRETIFFFIVFLFTGFCNTGSGFGYFQIKSKHKVTLASIAPHEAQVETLRGLWVVQLWVFYLGPFLPWVYVG